MNVWRINIKTDAVEGVDPRRFCLERNILGLGWPVGECESLDWDTYQTLGTAKYYDQDKDKGWWPAVNAIRNRMTEGDLCWTRVEDNYYLGRVAGAWQYRATPEHTAADVVNVRCCHWMRAGKIDSVPGKVLNSFRGRTVQRAYDRRNASKPRHNTVSASRSILASAVKCVQAHVSPDTHNPLARILNQQDIDSRSQDI